MTLYMIGIDSVRLENVPGISVSISTILKMIIPIELKLVSLSYLYQLDIQIIQCIMKIEIMYDITVL